MDNKTLTYDLSFLQKFTKGDNAKMGQYINTYLRTSERIFKELIQACSDRDWESLYIKAHSIKPQVQYMGISALQGLIVEIENDAKLNPIPEKLEILVKNASDIYYKSADELKLFLSEMNTESQ